MPIVTFHLAGSHPDASVGRLLEQAVVRYAEVLECPVDRVRALAVRYPTGWAVVGSGPASAGVTTAYFTALVLAGRPVGQRHALLAAFTDLIADELELPRESVRGRIEQVDPDDWGIGGVPASAVRAGEIADRRR